MWESERKGDSPWLHWSAEGSSEPCLSARKLLSSGRDLKQFWGQQTRGATGEKVGMNGAILFHGAVVRKLCCN